MKTLESREVKALAKYINKWNGRANIQILWLDPRCDELSCILLALCISLESYLLMRCLLKIYPAPNWNPTNDVLIGKWQNHEAPP